MTVSRKGKKCKSDLLRNLCIARGPVYWRWEAMGLYHVALQREAQDTVQYEISSAEKQIDQHQ